MPPNSWRGALRRSPSIRLAAARARVLEPLGRAAAGTVEALAAPIAAPVSLVLTSALRRLARIRPDVFERLGGYGACAFRICPDELPVAFVLRPGPRGGGVRVVARDAPGYAVATVRGPLGELLALFDGRRDADAAYFGRALSVEGDTSAVMALHNALEAADLELADLLPGAPSAMAKAARRAWTAADGNGAQPRRRGSSWGR